jgi:hypothetical protein
MGLLMIGPYHCQFCAHRFLVILGRISFSPGRKHKRVPVQYPVYFRPAFGTDAVLAAGTMLDLSIGGCTIETPVPVPKAFCLGLQLQVTEQAPPIQIENARVRTVNGKRLGLEFLSLRPEEKDRLRQLTLSVLSGRPSEPAT